VNTTGLVRSRSPTPRQRFGAAFGVTGESSLLRGAGAPCVLFLSRLNAARSIIAEAILNALAQGRVRAFSAGDHSSWQPNPYALECLAAHGMATGGLHSKGWGEFCNHGAPTMRCLIRLCETEVTSQHWVSGVHRPVIAHWDMPDPAAVVGSAVDIRLAFEEAFGTLAHRCRRFLALSLDRLDDHALGRALSEIGEAQ
jgi:arsenate reductase